MIKKIPTIYDLIVQKLISFSHEGEIELSQAKLILSHYFRIPKNKLGIVLLEMKEWKMINFRKIHNGVCCLAILVTPNEDLVYAGRLYRGR